MENPLLAPSPLPYGYPPFDRIRPEHFREGFDRGMAEHREEVAAIVANEDPPSFENTIVALELAGETLQRVQRIFGNLTAAHTSPELEKIQADYAPRLAAHLDAILLDEGLFRRIEELFAKREQLGLDAESLRLLERYHRDFVRAGARLSAEQKERLKAINAELAALQTRFSQNVLNEVNASAVLFDSAEALEGLEPAELEAAAKRAAEAGHPGKWLIALQNTTGQPPLAKLKRRESRQRIHEASVARGSRGGDYDNREVVAKMAALRAERAALLGYPNHAAYQLEVATARTPEAVETMLRRLAPAAVANARREAEEIQAMIRAEGGDFELAPWDWSYYAEKVRQRKFAFDGEALRPYFELNQVLEKGVFYSAERLFGIRFQERKDLPVYHPDVRVWEVFEEDGRPLGIFIGDFYARPSKRGGAWMNAYVPQDGLRNRLAVVGNHLNVPKPPEGQPTLLTFDEVTTLFHEFGHALHGLFSAVRYPLLSGTAVPRDFVEYPSQVYEMWATWPEVLANYARHHQTGEPIPQELIDKVLAAETFNQGFATTEYLASSVTDLAIHALGPGQTPGDVMDFEARTLAAWGLDFPPVPPRYRYPYFSHIFGGGYSAGYYSYVWSEVLDADTVAWFKENGGLSRENGQRFRERLLSRGATAEAMDLYRALTGRDPDIRHLLKRRGLEAGS
ncbi:MAG: M3 family metallopeptidase [Xanthomonadales bacterium]|nr:M3 family metallopeptidase [Xanthomonadales bacterium]